MHADKRGRLLTEPSRKLAASATETLGKCLMSKIICRYFKRWFLGGGGGTKLFPEEVGAARIYPTRYYHSYPHVVRGINIYVFSLAYQQQVNYNFMWVNIYAFS
jgi:hypothetical protein